MKLNKDQKKELEKNFSSISSKVTNPLKYNKNKPRFTLLPLKALIPAIRAFEYGEHKYSIYQDPETGEQYLGSQITIEEVNTLNLVRTYSGSYNWRTGDGIEKNKLLDSTIRHIVEVTEGNNIDSESKLHHIGHAISNLIMYSDLYINNKE